jgi:cell division protein FtsB
LKDRIIVVVGLLIVLVLFFSLLRSYKNLKNSNKEIAGAQKKVDDLANENISLDQRLGEVKSQEYIEKELRDKLGLAKENEIVVVLPDEEVLKKYAPEIDNAGELPPDPNWKKWARLFGLSK